MRPRIITWIFAVVFVRLKVVDRRTLVMEVYCRGRTLEAQCGEKSGRLDQSDDHSGDIAKDWSLNEPVKFKLLEDQRLSHISGLKL